MTKREAVRQLRKINPEWAKAFEEQKLNPRAMHSTGDKDTLSRLVIRTFDWCASQKGHTYWYKVYCELDKMNR